jgi:hypothetical protein
MPDIEEWELKLDCPDDDEELKLSLGIIVAMLESLLHADAKLGFFVAKYPSSVNPELNSGES